MPSKQITVILIFFQKQILGAKCGDQNPKNPKNYFAKKCVQFDQFDHDFEHTAYLKH